MDPVTLVVGRNSFLARCFAATPGRPDCRFVGHEAIADAGVFAGVDRILNFALDPAWRRADCLPEQDLDLRLGRIAAERGLRYVLLSSRKVYDPAAADGAAETAPLAPVDPYGRNKLAAERGLAAMLGDRLLVLRVANVVGWEYQPQRPTFMGMMLAGLAERGRITLDVSPFVERDFLPAEDFARALAAALRHDLAGVYNLGSGQGTAVGRLALWLIEGFGAGTLSVVSPRAADAFRLDVTRLRQVLGEGWPPARPLEDYCRALGRRLRQAVGGPEGPAAPRPND